MEENIKDTCKKQNEGGRGEVDWIELNQQYDRWWALVNLVKNFRFP